MKKQKRGRKLEVHTQMLCGTGQELREALEAMACSGLITTSFIERLNLTLCQIVAPLSRKTGRWLRAMRSC